MSSDEITDHWDFYSCEIEGKPHSTMVNLSLFDIAPVPKINLFHSLEVTLKYPDPEYGMTTNEEFQLLGDLEGLIGRSETEHLRYVARKTGGGKRKFYFYTSPDVDFASFIDGISHAFPAYEKTTFNFEDADWQTYFKDLYLNAIGMNEISNRSVFFRLEANGDNLDIPRVIDHTIIFKNSKPANEFSKIVEGKGFTVEINASGIFSKRYDLLVQRVDLPSKLDPITYELNELAAGLGGSYDGWGCIAQTSSD